MIKEPRDAEAMDGPGDGDVATSQRAKRRHFVREVPIDQQETVPAHQSVLGGYQREAAILKDERASPTSWLSTLPSDVIAYYMDERYLRPKPAVTRWSINHLFGALDPRDAFRLAGQYISVKEFAVRGSNAYFSAALNCPRYATELFVIVVSADRSEPRVVKLDILPTVSLMGAMDGEECFLFELVNDDTEIRVTIFNYSANFIAFFSLDGAYHRIIPGYQSDSPEANALLLLHRAPWMSNNQVSGYIQSGNLIVARGVDPSLRELYPDGPEGQFGTKVPQREEQPGQTSRLFYSPFLAICETGLVMLDPVDDTPGEPKLQVELRHCRRRLTSPDRDQHLRQHTCFTSNGKWTLEHDCCSPDGSYVLRTNVAAEVYIFETRARRVLTVFDGINWDEHENYRRRGMCRTYENSYCRTFACCLIDNNHYCSVIWGGGGLSVEIRG